MYLLFPAAVGILYRQPHRIGDLIRIHNYPSADVSRRAPRGLRQRTRASQKALLVGVHDRHQRNFGQIESLAQQVYADQHVEQSGAQIVEDLHPFERIDVGMNVPAADSHPVEIFIELFGHSFGQGRHQHPLVRFGADFDLLDQVVDLVQRRTHLHRRIDQPGRADKLFDHRTLRFDQLVVGRRGAHIDHLIFERFEFVELQRSVVQRGRQPVAVIDQVVFTRTVPAEHPPYLRDRHVTLVDNQQKVFREIIDQAEGPTARRTPVEIARIVLDPGTITQFLNHLQVVFDALFEPPGLGRLTDRLEKLALFPQIELDHPDRLLDAFARRHEQIGRVNDHAFERFEPLSGHRIDQADHLDLVIEENHPIALLAVSGENIDRIAVYTERGRPEIVLAAGVERIDQRVQQFVATDHIADFQLDRRGMEVLGIADPVYARHARYDDDVVTAAQQRRSGAEPHFLDPFVDRQILFDKSVRRRQVSLGLVIVVIRDEIFDRILRKEVFELAVELRRKRFVMAHDQRRLIQRGDHVGHRKRLARTGNAEQRIVPATVPQRRHELPDRFGLIPGGAVFRYQFEIHGAKVRIDLKIRSRRTVYSQNRN